MCSCGSLQREGKIVERITIVQRGRHSIADSALLPCRNAVTDLHYLANSARLSPRPVNFDPWTLTDRTPLLGTDPVPLSKPRTAYERQEFLQRLL